MLVMTGFYYAALAKLNWWIGGYKTGGEWRWISEQRGGSPMTYTTWAKGEPNNAGKEEEDCLELRAELKSFWNDEECALKSPYICERKLNVELIG